MDLVSSQLAYTRYISIYIKLYVHTIFDHVFVQHCSEVCLLAACTRCYRVVKMCVSIYIHSERLHSRQKTTNRLVQFKWASLSHTLSLAPVLGVCVRRAFVSQSHTVGFTVWAGRVLQMNLQYNWAFLYGCYRKQTSAVNTREHTE